MRQNLKIKWPWNINLWTDNKSTVAINPFIINIECSQQQQPKTAIQFTKLHLLLFTIKMKKVHLITCTCSRVQNKTKQNKPHVLDIQYLLCVCQDNCAPYTMRVWEKWWLEVAMSSVNLNKQTFLYIKIHVYQQIAVYYLYTMFNVWMTSLPSKKPSRLICNVISFKDLSWCLYLVKTALTSK